MLPYEKVMPLLKGGKIDQIPCVNFTSCATIDLMRLADAWWPHSHLDAERMAMLASAAHRFCGLDNISLPFDMTVEAEVLGAKISLGELDLNKGNVSWPHPKTFMEKLEDIKFPDRASDAGRVPTILKAIKLLNEEFYGKVPINAYMAPPFTCASNYLFNPRSFLVWLIKNPEKVHDLLNSIVGVFTEIASIYREAGADIITLHEMGASCNIISPAHFDEFVKPYLKKIILRVKSPVVLSVCGASEPIISSMIECGADAIAIDERTPMKRAREIADKLRKGYPVIGNLSPIQVIHRGPAGRIREEVKKCIADGASMVSPGCDFWIMTPIDHVKALVGATLEYGGGRS